VTPFQLGTEVHIGSGCRSLLPQILEQRGWRRPLLVTDAGLAGQELVQGLWDSVLASGVEGRVFDAVESNPRTTTAEAIAQLAVETDRDLVLGLGGGSSLDAAKAAAMLATNGGRALDYVGRQHYACDPLPMVALPTTCGTGSEVTWVSVLTDVETSTKISIKGRQMFPTVALVDSDFLETLPGVLVATTAMDALTHALEATIGCRRNPISDALAEKAIMILLDVLPGLALPSLGEATREALMRASTLAGLAFGNADVGAVHCLSESLGGLQDLPHGLCNAILLVPVLRAHGTAIESRLSELAGLIGGDQPPSAQGMLLRIEEIVESLGIGRFDSLGVATSALPALAEAAASNGSNASNPRRMDAADYRQILEALM